MEELLKKEGICLAVTDKLAKDSGVATASTYDAIVERLRAHRHARGTATRRLNVDGVSDKYPSFDLSELLSC